MDNLRIGVIGVGHLGSLHAKLLAEIPGVTLTGVYDSDAGRARSVAAEARSRAFRAISELLEEVDAVTIATPTTSHAEVAEQAFAAGRDAFIEKPITETVPEADHLCALARQTGRILQVGHIERFNPAILALDGYTIRPLFIESHRLAQFRPRGTDVAVVLDLMIHDIDLILSFVDSPVERIDANGVAVVSDTIDIANARLQFENGCVANVTASRISQRRMRKMRMFQPNAYISLDFSEGLAEVYRLLGDEGADAPGGMTLGEIGVGERKRRIVYEQPEVKEVNALKHELELFAGAVRSRTRPVVSGEDARRALDVAQKIMHTIHEHTVSM